MKKVLFALTAVCALNAAVAGDAPKGPSLEITGKVMGYGMGVTQDQRSIITDDTSLGSKGELRFNAKAEASNGLSYGGVAAIDLRKNKVGKTDFFRDVFVFVSSPKLGTVQLGDLEGVEVQGSNGPRDIMGGTGAWDGRMWDAAHITSGVVIETRPGYTTGASKIVLKSPILNMASDSLFKGTQFMLGYTPQSKYYGSVAKTTNKANEILGDDPAGMRQHIAVGVSQGLGHGDFGLNLYAVGTMAKGLRVNKTSGARTSLHNVKAYELGFLADYKDIQLAAGFTDHQRSLMAKEGSFSVGNAGKVYNAAVSYKMGPTTVALGGLFSQRKVTGGHAKAKVVSLTVDHNIVAGLSVFGEANYFQTKAPQDFLTNLKNDATAYDPWKAVSGTVNENNKGGVFLLGTNLRF
jgi:predicted porin